MGESSQGDEGKSHPEKKESTMNRSIATGVAKMLKPTNMQVSSKRTKLMFPEWFCNGARDLNGKGEWTVHNFGPRHKIFRMRDFYLNKITKNPKHQAKICVFPVF